MDLGKAPARGFLPLQASVFQQTAMQVCFTLGDPLPGAFAIAFEGRILPIGSST